MQLQKTDFQEWRSRGAQEHDAHTKGRTREALHACYSTASI